MADAFTLGLHHALTAAAYAAGATLPAAGLTLVVVSALVLSRRQPLRHRWTARRLRTQARRLGRIPGVEHDGPLRHSGDHLAQTIRDGSEEIRRGMANLPRRP